jgi:hypothetical protein
MIKLNEPHAAFGESPRQETVRAERPVRPLRAVHVEHVSGLVLSIHEFGNAGLHAERHLVLADARRDLGVVQFQATLFVERLYGVEHIALAFVGDSLRTFDVQHRITRAAKLDPLETAGQESRMPLPRRDRLSLTKLAGRHHHHEARQVIRFGAQAVQQPRTHRRSSRDHGARVHERVGRIVIDGVGVERTHDAQFIGAATSQLRPHGTQLLSRIAESLERMLRGEAREFGALQLSDLLPLGDRFGHRLSVHLGQLGLKI